MKTLIICATVLFLQLANADGTGTWVTCTSVEVAGFGSSVNSHGPIGDLDFSIFYLQSDRNQARQVGEATLIYTASNKTIQMSMVGEYGKDTSSVKMNELENLEGENQARQELFSSQIADSGLKTNVRKIYATLCKFSERIPVYEEPQGGFHWGSGKTSSDIRSASLAEIRRLLTGTR